MARKAVEFAPEAVQMWDGGGTVFVPNYGTESTCMACLLTRPGDRAWRYTDLRADQLSEVELARQVARLDFMRHLIHEHDYTASFARTAAKRL